MAWATFPVEFQGGLISSMNPLKQATSVPGSAIVLQNFEPSKDGGYKKVQGYSKFSTSMVPGNTTNYKILGVKVVSPGLILAARENVGGKTQYYTSTGTTWASVGEAPLLGGKIRTHRYNLGAGDRIALVDGVNYPIYYNVSGSTLTLPTFPSDLLAAEQVCVFRATTFYSVGSNLIYSAPGSDTDFTSASGGGIINIGSPITGIIPFRNELFIFTRSQIKKLSGSSAADFVLSPVADNIGCPYPDTIQEVGGDVMFMSPDGFRFLSATDRNNDFGLDLASDSINKEALDFVKGTSTFNSLVIRGKAQYRVFAYKEGTQPAFSQGLVATKFSDQGASRVEWGQLTGFKVYSCDSAYTSAGEIVAFGFANGYVYLMESGYSFDGEDIEATYKSPYLVFEDPQVRKTLYKMTLHVDTRGVLELDVDVYLDAYKAANITGVNPNTIRMTADNSATYLYGSSDAIFGVASYGTDPDMVFDTPLVGSGRTISFRLYDKSTNPSYTLESAVIEYRMNDRK